VEVGIRRSRQGEKAKKFTRSAALPKAMKAAGVRGKPDVFFLQESARSIT